VKRIFVTLPWGRLEDDRQSLFGGACVLTALEGAQRRRGDQQAAEDDSRLAD
jgi:hypothetical protein